LVIKEHIKEHKGWAGHWRGVAMRVADMPTPGEGGSLGKAAAAAAEAIPADPHRREGPTR